MNILYGLIQNKRCLNTEKVIEKKSRQEAFAVFNALTLKEKCLYLIKISKRNTGYQALVLMELILVIIAVDYLVL
ncbi:MAG: hypothetical protein ACOWWO_20050 [Peptococcaceae bacterium]